MATENPKVKTEAEVEAEEIAPLQYLAHKTNREVVALTVDKGLEALCQLRHQFETQLQGEPDSHSARTFKNEINSLIKDCSTPFTTKFGVYGATGAGKSSLLNAVVDQEGLLPTHGSRACTASIIEVKYNDDNDPARLYRAEIEFINESSWADELRILLDDVKDGDGDMARDAEMLQDEIKISMDKVRAVYPSKTKAQLLNTTATALMEELREDRILGTIKEICMAELDPFRAEVRKYIATKAKTTMKKDSNEERRRELWPLIKVVKIYTKADALRTGAILVDLPGVQDSNAARSAVAGRYMQQCNDIWIATRIQRACDDQAAQDLLDRGFRQQLKMDGIYSNITFICTQSDNINSSEIIDTEPELAKEVDNLTKMRCDEEASIEREEGNVDKIRTKMEEKQIQIKALSKKITELNKTRKRFYPDKSTTNKSTKNKRKMEGIDQGPKTRSKDNKQLHFDDNGQLTQRKPSGSSTNEESENQVELLNPVSTKEEILNEIEAKKAEVAGIKNDLQSCQQHIAVLDTRILKQKVQAAAYIHKIDALCIKYRNKQCKEAIRDRFAEETAKFDQSIARVEAGANSTEESHIRDDVKITEELPVFCISSPAYHNLIARGTRKAEFEKFDSIELTEIPLLQRHCATVTQKGQDEKTRVFLTRLQGLMSFMKLWTQNDDITVEDISARRKKNALFFEEQFRILFKKQEQVLLDIRQELIDAFKKDIMSRITPAVRNAKKAALEVLEGHKRIPWPSYRATLRRNGVFTNSKGVNYQFNKDLSATMRDHLQKGIEVFFEHDAKEIVDGATRKLMELVTRFMELVASRAKQEHSGIIGLDIVLRKMPIYHERMVQQANEGYQHLKEERKTLSRADLPIIEDYMRLGYENCRAETGTGSLNRMKICIHDHVDEKKHKMFMAVGTAIHKHCEEMGLTTIEELWSGYKDIFHVIEHDFWNTVGGRVEVEAGGMPESERELREHVRKLITASEDIFSQLVDNFKESIARSCVQKDVEMTDFGPHSKEQTDEDLEDYDDDSTDDEDYEDEADDVIQVENSQALQFEHFNVDEFLKTMD